MHFEEKAHIPENSSQYVEGAGVEYVIIGHSREDSILVKPTNP